MTMTSEMPPATLPYLTRQDWHAYTPDDDQAWSLLYARRMAALRTTGSRVFLDGAAAIGLASDRVPDLDDVNRRLGARTGWAASSSASGRSRPLRAPRPTWSGWRGCSGSPWNSA